MREILKQKLLWIAAFGYFVDLFDLVLYGVVRVDSLKSLGYVGDELFSVGSTLLNIQMAGMLVGGLIWGLIGDRRGRKEALFGSILIYSLATFLNGFVHSFEAYASLRFLAGLGLAGELGAAVTIVSESLPQGYRGIGSAFIATIGFLGAVCSSYFNQHISWQHAYMLGGSLGFLLFTARLGIKESPLYLDARSKTKKLHVPKSHATLIEEENNSEEPPVRKTSVGSFGSISLLFSSGSRFKKIMLAFLTGVPIWYVAGILSYFAPEFAKELGTQGVVTAGTTIMVGYCGSILGDIVCGLLSQKLKSRKRAVLIFMVIGGLLAVGHPFFTHGSSATVFYWIRFAIGFGNGFFAILIAWIAEMFGTNLRATLTTFLSNLIRASVIPLTLSFQGLKPSLGLMNSSILIGAICFSVAIFSAIRLPETFHDHLNFFEG
jgi:putative MFS transporter